MTESTLIPIFKPLSENKTPDLNLLDSKIQGENAVTDSIELDDKTIGESKTEESTMIDSKNLSYFDRKRASGAKYKKLFKNCCFLINDISLSYREYFEACKGRCTVSVVSFRNRLIDMILKRGGSIELGMSPYVTHFIVERTYSSQTWWTFRRIKGNPSQYHFVTAKYVVECHLKGKRLEEKLYFPKFLETPQFFKRSPSSNESTPKRVMETVPSPNPTGGSPEGSSPGEGRSVDQGSKQECFRYVQTWSQLVESECLEDFEHMDCGIYMDGNILYIFLENFLVDLLLGPNLDIPAVVCQYGQVLSSNGLARSMGVRRGMEVQKALDLCRDLRMAKYDYDRVTERGLELLRLFQKYTRHILSPYYNEYYLQIPYESCRSLLENSTSNGNENICRLASKILQEIPGECVIGIGKNMLISKLASKKCRNLKINSQESDYDYQYSPVLSIKGMENNCSEYNTQVWSYVSENICIVNDGFKFLNGVFLTEIPGVGLLGPVLKSRGLVTCNDVRKKGSPLCLQSILGGRVGKLVYNFCFGYDYRCSNLPKKQLDFFLNKSFSSSTTIDPGKICGEGEITKLEESVIEGSENVKKEESKGPEGWQRANEDEARSVPGVEPAPISQDSPPVSTEFQRRNEERIKEEQMLKSLLTKILRDVCSVYSLFDKCIINYSIKYKCTLGLKVHFVPPSSVDYSSCEAFNQDRANSQSPNTDCNLADVEHKRPKLSEFSKNETKIDPKPTDNQDCGVVNLEHQQNQPSSLLKSEHLEHKSPEHSHYRAVTCILDKQSLRHATYSLYDSLKKDQGIDFFRVRRVELEVKEVVRVDENLKFIDKFLTERNKGGTEFLETPRDRACLSQTFDTASVVSTETSKEQFSTPTRRINGWRVDPVSPESTTPQSFKRPGSLRGTPSPVGSRFSFASSDSRERSSVGSDPGSSVERSVRTPSRNRRALALLKGQKHITEYLSPNKLHSS